MYRTILCAAVGAVIFAMSAKADETLKYRIVQHATSNQNLQVGDVDRHFIGVSRLVGIAFFSDGGTATSVVWATYDTTPPSGQGTASGYNTVTFPDGSELWFKWAGTINFGPKVTEKGTSIVVGGKGRYAGAKGDGTWEEGQSGSGADVIQYIDAVINIKQ
jgi:hypothetical protein